MIRKVDELGRIVLPIEYRQALNIKERDEIEITLNTNEITLKKYIFGCYFCGSAADLVRIGDKAACRSCGERICTAKDDEVLYPISVE